MRSDNGYEQVEASEEKTKKHKNKYRSPSDDRRKEKEKELKKLRREESKWKKL